MFVITKCKDIGDVPEYMLMIHYKDLSKKLGGIKKVMVVTKRKELSYEDIEDLAETQHITVHRYSIPNSAKLGSKAECIEAIKGLGLCNYESEIYIYD